MWGSIVIRSMPLLDSLSQQVVLSLPPPPAISPTHTHPHTPLTCALALMQEAFPVSAAPAPPAPSPPPQNVEADLQLLADEFERKRQAAAQQPAAQWQPPPPQPEAPVSQPQPPQHESRPPLAGDNVMNLVFVGAECAPWSKTGERAVLHCGSLLYVLFFLRGRNLG